MASTSGSNGAGPSTTLVPISELRSLCSNALKTLGYKESEVEILTEVSARL